MRAGGRAQSKALSPAWHQVQSQLAQLGSSPEGDEPPSGMSLRALKAELGVRSVETAGLLERSELVHALLQARLVAPQEWLVGLS